MINKGDLLGFLDNMTVIVRIKRPFQEMFLFQFEIRTGRRGLHKLFRIDFLRGSFELEQWFYTM